jgi:hypothetical protein
LEDYLMQEINGKPLENKGILLVCWEQVRGVQLVANAPCASSKLKVESKDWILVTRFWILDKRKICQGKPQLNQLCFLSVINLTGQAFCPADVGRTKYVIASRYENRFKWY